MIYDEQPKKKTTREDDRLAAFEAWRSDPSEPNTKNFLSSVDDIVSGALKTHAPGLEDSLRTQAKIMALDVARKYDPARGSGLGTHMYHHLHGLSRVYGKRKTPLYIPENRSLLNAKINNTVSHFESEHGREPTVEELCDRTGLSIKKLEKLRSYSSGEDMSRSSRVTEEGSDLAVIPMDRHRMWVEYVYHDMDPIDKKIFEWSTGYGGTKRLSKHEMAAKLRVSAPAVSSRINKILRKITEGDKVRAR
jgi:DNA-directed RNA polymerase specialized sigma subunit